MAEQAGMVFSSSPVPPLFLSLKFLFIFSLTPKECIQMSLAIDNTLVVTGALKTVVSDMVAILADGKLTFSDARYVPELVTAVNAGLLAAGGVLPELKDLDAEETAVLAKEMYELVKMTIAAFSKSKV